MDLDIHRERNSLANTQLTVIFLFSVLLTFWIIFLLVITCCSVPWRIRSILEFYNKSQLVSGSRYLGEELWQEATMIQENEQTYLFSSDQR